MRRIYLPSEALRPYRLINAKQDTDMEAEAESQDIEAKADLVDGNKYFTTTTRSRRSFLAIVLIRGEALNEIRRRQGSSTFALLCLFSM